MLLPLAGSVLASLPPLLVIASVLVLASVYVPPLVATTGSVPGLVVVEGVVLGAMELAVGGVMGVAVGGAVGDEVVVDIRGIIFTLSLKPL